MTRVSVCHLTSLLVRACCIIPCVKKLLIIHSFIGGFYLLTATIGLVSYWDVNPGKERLDQTTAIIAWGGDFSLNRSPASLGPASQDLGIYDHNFFLSFLFICDLYQLPCFTQGGLVVNDGREKVGLFFARSLTRLFVRARSLPC